MVDNTGFTFEAWNEYTSWQTEDKRILKKINEPIKDITRSGHGGIGHPEPLKYNIFKRKKEAGNLFF